VIPASWHTRFKNVVKSLSQFLSPENRYPLLYLWLSAKTRWYYMVIAVAFGIASAFFEGNTMGLLAIAVSVLIEDNDNSLINSLGPLTEPLQQLQLSMTDETLFVALVIVGAMSQIVRSLMDFGNRVVASFLSVHMETDFQKKMFRQYMQMSYSDFMTYKLGDISSLLNYARDVGVFMRTINALIVTLATILFYVIVLLIISPVLMFASMILLLPMGLISSRMMESIRETFRDAFSIRIELNEQITEYLQASFLLRAYSRENYANTLVEKLIDRGEKNLRSGFVWYSLNYPVFSSISIILVAVFLFVTVFLIPRDVASLSLTLAFLAVLWRLSGKITQLNNEMATLNRNWAQVRRISDILRTDNKTYLLSGGEPVTSFEDHIIFKDVTHIYSNSSEVVLNSLNIRIDKGQTVAMVGESGSGKSTIVNLLLRLYDPAEGEIIVDNHNLRDLNLSDWRNQLSVVSQDTFIFNDTVMNNIRFGNLDATDEDIIEAARSANAHGFITDFDNGYETLVGERGTRLSGGQRQRIALARALVRNTEIIILDEATSALDSETEKKIQDAIDSLYGHKTLIIVAHRLSTIKQADKIIVLDSGEVIEHGTHHQLLNQEGVYAQYWRLQVTYSQD
jgi:ATP-binding cassette subfamily B protein/subfamily B ATP-binding cassette protein MsbA